MLALQLPSNFFDKPPNAASASLSGREHAVEGFFDEAPAVGAKRPRDPDEEEEPTQETEEMEEAGENEEATRRRGDDEASSDHEVAPSRVTF